MKKQDDVTESPKMGRPPKPIDWKIFEQLCHIQCTHEEIASFCHVARDTLYERVEKEYGETFPTVYKRFSEGGKSSLRRHQFRMAEKNCSMAIWLGKQYLGQKETDENRMPESIALATQQTAILLEQIKQAQSVARNIDDKSNKAE